MCFEIDKTAKAPKSKFVYKILCVSRVMEPWRSKVRGELVSPWKYIKSLGSNWLLGATRRIPDDAKIETNNDDDVICFAEEGLYVFKDKWTALAALPRYVSHMRMRFVVVRCRVNRSDWLRTCTAHLNVGNLIDRREAGDVHTYRAIKPEAIVAYSTNVTSSDRRAVRKQQKALAASYRAARRLAKQAQGV